MEPGLVLGVGVMPAAISHGHARRGAGVTGSDGVTVNQREALVVPAGSRVDVLGADGDVFLRMAPEGSMIRTGSAEYALHRRILRLADPGAVAWIPIGEPTRTSWVDPRLRRDGGPPADARTLVDPVELARWHVPVVVDGRPGEVVGATLWVPAPSAGTPAQGGSTGSAAALLGVLAVGLSAMALLAHRAARRRAGAPRPDLLEVAA